MLIIFYKYLYYLSFITEIQTLFNIAEKYRNMHWCVYFIFD